jgi:hypothetical protein
MNTVTQQGRLQRITLVVSLLVLASVGFLGQPKLALAQSAWSSGSIANAVGAMRANQSPSRSDSKGQNRSGTKGGFEIQVSGQGTTGKIAKWTDNNGTLGDSVLTESSSGKVGIGTASPPKPLTVISPDAYNGIGVGKDDGLNLLLIGYDNATNRGTIGSFAGGVGSTLNLNQLGGNVSIGTTSWNANLDVQGNVTVSGNIAAKYQDVAEWVPASRAIPAGTVVVLDPELSNHVLASTRSYDTRVAGVVSAKPGVLLGEGGSGKVMVATTGRVRVKVDATLAPIRVGDLLVTSDKEGIAMRSQPLDLGGTPIHRPGTLIGKALEPLDKGSGEILVLLSLQ